MTKIVIAIAVVSLIALLAGLYKIPHISKRITKQVIFLYETMEDILESSSKQKNF